MDHFDNMRDRLRSDKSGLPEGFGWEDMKDGIYDKLDESEKPLPAYSVQTKRIIAALLLIIFGLSVALVHSYFDHRETHPADTETREDIYKNNEVKDNTREKTEVNYADAKVIKDHGISNNSASAGSNQLGVMPQSEKIEEGLATSAADIRQPEVKNTTSISNRGFDDHDSDLQGGMDIQSPSHIVAKMGAYQKSKVTEREDNAPENAIPSTSSKTDPIHTEPVDHEDIVQDTNAAATSSSEGVHTANVSLVPGQESTAGDAEDNTPQSIKRSWYVLAPIRMLDMHLTADAAPIAMARPQSTPYPSLIEPVGASPWSLEIGTGYNLLWNLAANGSAEGTIYESIGTDYGYSLGLRLNRRLNDRLSFSAGLGLDRYYQELNSVSTTLTPRTLEQTTLSVFVNAISGKETVIIGDTIVMDTTITSVRQPNRFDVVSVPMMIHYGRSYGGWRVEAGAGLNVSLLRGYDGKYLQGETVVEYQTADALYTNGVRLGYGLSGRVSRSLGRGLYAGVNVDYLRNIGDWGLSSETTFKPQMMRGQIFFGIEI